MPAVTSHPGAPNQWTMALDQMRKRSPFYDPSVTTGMGPGWQDDPFNNVPYQYGEQNPEAPWTKNLSEMGFGGLDSKSTFARGLYGRYREGYESMSMERPGYTWQEHMKTMLSPAAIEDQWNRQGPAGRGQNVATDRPNSRWLRRP